MHCDQTIVIAPRAPGTPLRLIVTPRPSSGRGPLAGSGVVVSFRMPIRGRVEPPHGLIQGILPLVLHVAHTTTRCCSDPDDVLVAQWLVRMWRHTWHFRPQAAATSTTPDLLASVSQGRLRPLFLSTSPDAE